MQACARRDRVRFRGHADLERLDPGIANARAVAVK